MPNTEPKTLPKTVIAEFESSADAIAAAVAMHAIGHDARDAYMPYPVPELEKVLAIRRSRIPWAAFVAGAFGCIAAFVLVWWTSARDYPVDVGGRPLNSIPADIPLMFETTVLLAGVTAFALLFVRSGMPRLHHAIMEVDGFERISLDRFWLVFHVDSHVDSHVASLRDHLLALRARAIRGTEARG